MQNLHIERYQLIPKESEFESRGEKFRFWALVLGLSFPGYHIGLNTIITTIIGSNSIDTMLAYIILFGSILGAIIKTPKSQWRQYFFIPLLIIVGSIAILCMSAWLFPSNARIITRIRTTYIQTVCWGVLVANLVDNTKLYKRAFKLIGYIVFWFLVYEPFAVRSTLFIAADNSWGTSGYLTWGYRMLIAVILLLYTALESRRFIDWLFAIFSAIELILVGNRGSIVAIAIFIILYVLFCTNFQKKVKYITVITGLCVGVYSTLMSDKIIYLENLLLHLGIRSRNLTKFLEETITDSGRDKGYEIAIDYIRSGNYFGLGIGGDQILVGNYPHNILLEFMLQYGNIIGVILFAVLAISTINNILSIKNRDCKAIYIAFACLGLVKLWFSSTYWYELWFWGYLIFLLKTRKKVGDINDEGIHERITKNDY